MPKLKVFKQAELDSLCGLYSILNASRYLSPLARAAVPRTVFVALVKDLQRLMSLEAALCSGIPLPKLKKLARAAGQRYGGFSVSSLKMFAAKSNHPDIVAVAKAVCSTQGLVLCHIEPPHEHWTLVHKADDQGLSVLDSSHFPKAIPKTRIKKGDYEIALEEGLIFLPT